MKYKYSRKEIADWIKEVIMIENEDGEQRLIGNLLATKETKLTQIDFNDVANELERLYKPKKIIKIGIDQIHNPERMAEYVSHKVLIGKINEIIDSLNSK